MSSAALLPSTPGDIGAAATLTMLQKLAKGIPMGKSSLFLLAFVPFTGILGTNNAAMGNSSVALLKSTSFLVLGGLLSFMLPYYPWFLRVPITWISLVGPWYLFDLLEFIDAPTFNKVGFRLPLNMELPGLTQEPPNRDGNWKLTTPLALSIAAAFATSGMLVAKYIPADILPATFANNISAFSAGSGLLLGLAAVTLAVTTAGPVGAAAVGATVVPNPLMSVPSAFTPVMGGGGGTLPPLSYFAGKLLKSKSPDESYAFFSVIALVILGGVVTAWSK